MGLKVYKKGQGAVLRYFAIGSLLLLELYGAYSLYWFLSRYDAMRIFPWAIEVPLFENFSVNWSLLISCLFYVGVAVATYLFLNRARVADLLIDTETETKKISWPSWSEAVNSAIVVIVFLIIIGLFIVAVDFTYSHIFEVIF